MAESLGDEAARLLHVVRDWAETTGDGGECRGCPLCRGVRLLQGIDPEVRRHLRDAGASLVSAAAALMATSVPDRGPAQDVPDDTVSAQDRSPGQHTHHHQRGGGQRWD